MFGLGVPELVLILIIGLVIFGPGRLPDIGKALGKSIKEFKSANNEPEAPRTEINVTEQAKRLSEDGKTETKS
ncbi:twin-arginine translocase TatA/TatE family subunit [Selenomonas sp. F0473]|uniref:twin-arginine translocase TatA/TatE family subunit n=1 Tax=Selenomonas sp. F0473 TaxID=999423 RepID=UPI00029EBAA0|nr:twin-arginine translocase TatA/TatE family subunit [Selenomonas sp. F0473]EKU72250.1 TatA/E family twin arginine-targeting protein translocase [Selenomonas sp. F0473]